MKDILLVTDHIGQDGTGRFITYLANGLSSFEDYKVSLLIFHHEDRAFNNDISNKVNIVELNLNNRIRYSLPTIIRKISDLAPDICIILYTQLVYLSLLASPIKKKGTKIIFRETIIPSKYRGNSSWLSKYICRLSYRKYDRIVAQSIDMAQDMISKWGCKSEMIQVINNPISVEKIKGIASKGEKPSEMCRKDKPVYLSAGRLSYQKGYDIILKRMVEMKPNIPFDYYIIGDGENKEEVETLVRQYELEENVKLLGFRPNPYDYISNCDALVLSSRYEGFPNIVLEANALGIPVFTNTCPGGINEIIENGVNGIACDFEDPQSFKKGLAEFQQRFFDSSAITDMTIMKYSSESIMKKYKQYFDNI